MRKIPAKYENPLDHILISIADKICPTFKKFGFTPNMITTLSLIFGLFAIVFLWKGYLVLFIVFYIISYFFDCLDGHYARKYNMVTKLGDCYDHLKDIIIAILSLVIIYIKAKNKHNSKLIAIILAIFIVFTFMGYVHLGCQEKYYEKTEGKNESCTLSPGKLLCPGNPNENLPYTRWFGMGTWVLVTISCAIILR